MNKKSNKNLSNFHLLSIVSVLILLGVFVLIMSGLFDSVSVPSTQFINNSNNSSSSSSSTKSVDLNALNEINSLEDIVKSNPKNHEALLKLGHLLNDNGFYERAIEKYNLYLNSHPTNVDVIVDMGVCYFELKKYDKSIEVIKSALVINPKHQIANFNLGIVNLANNNSAEAKQWWRKARDIDPNTNIGKKAEKLLKSNN